MSTLNKKSHQELFGTPWVWIKTSLLMKDNTWEHEKKDERKEFYSEPYVSNRWEEKYNYFYLLSDGTYQQCEATIHVEEREWIHEETADKKISKTINVEFSKELGPGVGSWKGGVIGTHYEMQEGETPLMTLRRMEKERKF